MFMQIAKTVAMRSTCHRLNVGAVLVSRDHNILSIGYNGAPEGRDHCQGSVCSYMTEAGCRVIHAEANALMRDRLGGGRDASLYITHSPCMECAALILNHSRPIANIYYEVEYRNTTPVDRLIQDFEGGIFRLSPSGYLLDRKTGKVVEV
jgi:dCMP deaminase